MSKGGSGSGWPKQADKQIARVFGYLWKTKDAQLEMKFNEKDPEQKKWADSLRLIFLDQNGRGQHVNISAAAILKASKKQRVAH